MPELNPASAVATRSTGTVVDGVTFAGDRTAVHVVYAEPSSDAQREFRRWVVRNGMTAQPVRTETGDELRHAHGAYDATGQARTRPDGSPCETLWPTAYRLFSPADVSGVDGLTYRAGRRRLVPVVYRRHPEIVLTPFGRGPGQGELPLRLAG
jgi:hypothetical protein